MLVNEPTDVLSKAKAAASVFTIEAPLAMPSITLDCSSIVGKERKTLTTDARRCLPGSCSA